MTSKKIVPEYVSRHKIESIVSESSTKPIIDDLFQLKPARAKVFVYDILESVRSCVKGQWRRCFNLEQMLEIERNIYAN